VYSKVKYGESGDKKFLIISSFLLNLAQF